MNVKLVVVQGKPEGKEILVRTPKFLIGRGPECHLRPNSELISRHHCMFVIDKTSVTLRDLGSTNGTLVNGERVTGDVAIYHEDLIQVGPLGFRIMLESVAASQPAAEVTDDAAAAAEATMAQASSVPKAGLIGARQASEGEIESWLVRDAELGTTSTGSELDEREADLEATKSEMSEVQDTQHDLPLARGATPPETDEDVVTLESGRKMKVGNAKAKIDKTRDDTSQAAAGILRRMMDRRSSH